MAASALLSVLGYPKYLLILIGGEALWAHIPSKDTPQLYRGYRMRLSSHGRLLRARNPFPSHFGSPPLVGSPWLVQMGH